VFVIPYYSKLHFVTFEQDFVANDRFHQTTTDSSGAATD